MMRHCKCCAGSWADYEKSEINPYGVFRECPGVDCCHDAEITVSQARLAKLERVAEAARRHLISTEKYRMELLWDTWEMLRVSLAALEQEKRRGISQP